MYNKMVIKDIVFANQGNRSVPHHLARCIECASPPGQTEFQIYSTCEEVPLVEFMYLVFTHTLYQFKFVLIHLFSCFSHAVLVCLQLAREAVQVKSATPHMVIGNQIITNVSPSFSLFRRVAA